MFHEGYFGIEKFFRIHAEKNNKTYKRREFIKRKLCFFLVIGISNEKDQFPAQPISLEFPFSEIAEANNITKVVPFALLLTKRLALNQLEDEFLIYFKQKKN